jgi:hypothetical protein
MCFHIVTDGLNQGDVEHTVPNRLGAVADNNARALFALDNHPLAGGRLDGPEGRGFDAAYLGHSSVIDCSMETETCAFRGLRPWGSSSPISCASSPVLLLGSTRIEVPRRKWAASQS